MQRDTLRTILERVAGLARDKDGYRTNEGHDLTLYLGEPGRAMVVSHVQRVGVQENHLEIEARDRGTLYAPIDSIHAVECSSTEKKGAKRSGVGFSG